jgi:hypothetical protein
MSLQNRVQCPGNALDGAFVEMEEKAKRFSGLVWDRKKKDAMEYFNKLDEKTKRYIQQHPRYKDDWKAARMQF